MGVINKKKKNNTHIYVNILLYFYHNYININRCGTLNYL
jgi:hypothetical protein